MPGFKHLPTASGSVAVGVISLAALQGDPIPVDVSDIGPESQSSKRIEDRQGIEDRIEDRIDGNWSRSTILA
jgi:hypothetical protein